MTAKPTVAATPLPATSHGQKRRSPCELTSRHYAGGGWCKHIRRHLTLSGPRGL
jgi:hypothetical protein